ncbi:hypothetical protein ABIS04_04025 [Shewanella sp. H8]|uniref:hypothetical protein n=1 Tax=Shewanella sp. H8 TaxID=3342676 RepID=UPI00331487A8
MKFNKRSKTLRLTKIKWQPRLAIYSFALVSLFSTYVSAKAADTLIERQQFISSNLATKNVKVSTSPPLDIITVGSLRDTISRPLNKRQHLES